MTEQRVSFTLPGPPVAWHRPKLSRSNRTDGRGIRVIKHNKDVEYQAALAMQATSAIMLWAQSFKKPWDGTGEWELEIEFHVHDLIKRDVDNMCKNVMDALSGITYDDDKQVVRLIVTKMLNRELPRTIVAIRRVHRYLEDRVAEAGVDLGAP
jgi:Holliday junction resolvase RusA-like endonuclease